MIFKLTKQLYSFPYIIIPILIVIIKAFNLVLMKQGKQFKAWNTLIYKNNPLKFKVLIKINLLKLL